MSDQTRDELAGEISQAMTSRKIPGSPMAAGGYADFAAHLATVVLSSDWLAAHDREVRAQALRDAVDEFESHVGVGEFEDQSTREAKPWAHVDEAWEHQGPYMDWLRNRAEQEASK